MKTYRKSKDAGVLPLSLSAHKSSWRDAHSILMIPKKDAGGQRPECFNLVARSFLGGKLLADEEFRTHVVGLASAPQKAGKFVLWRHERMPLPLSLITSIDLQEQLGSLLQNAERAALMLNRRIRRIAKLYLSPDAEDPGGRQADTEEISRVAKAMDSRPAFWARLEEHFYTLLEGLPNDWDAAGAGWKPDEQMEASNAWRENIKKEAKRALEESIRSLGNTARAIKSIAKVRTDFYDDDLEQPAAKSRDQ